MEVCSARAVRAGILVSALAGCLPVDTTPLAEVAVRLRASELSSEIPSTETSDGWEISFDRSLVTIHSASLASLGSECESAAADYERVLSLKRAEAQQVALLFALGACGFTYVIGPPFEPVDLVLGAGVSEADVRDMALASNALAGHPTSPGIPGFFVEGSARKDDTEKRFQWVFWDSFTPDGMTTCPTPRQPGLRLSTGDEAELDVLARGEALFIDSSQGGALSFSRFANADTDADGFISMTELGFYENTPDEFSLYTLVVFELFKSFTSPSNVECL